MPLLFDQPALQAPDGVVFDFLRPTTAEDLGTVVQEFGPGATLAGTPA